MSDRRTAPIASRKQPKQARSTELVAAILDAAVHILAEQGAHRFTTARVAERAGVSVGSLYQYFPNKAAILFRLQSREWQDTSALMARILTDRETPPVARLRALVHAFVRSECEEAVMRGALKDAAPLYRHAPEAAAARSSGQAAYRAFSEELLPDVDEATRTLAGDLIRSTLTEVGRMFSETPRRAAEIDLYAGAMADMLCGYVEGLQRR